MSNETLKDIITMDDDPMDARLDEEEWDEPTVTPLKERDNTVGTEKFDGETVKFFTHRLTAKFKTTSNGKNFNQHADEIGTKLKQLVHTIKSAPCLKKKSATIFNYKHIEFVSTDVPKNATDLQHKFGFVNRKDGRYGTSWECYIEIQMTKDRLWDLKDNILSFLNDKKIWLTKKMGATSETMASIGFLQNGDNRINAKFLMDELNQSLDAEVQSNRAKYEKFGKIGTFKSNIVLNKAPVGESFEGNRYKIKGLVVLVPISQQTLYHKLLGSSGGMAGMVVKESPLINSHKFVSFQMKRADNEAFCKAILQTGKSQSDCDVISVMGLHLELGLKAYSKILKDIAGIRYLEPAASVATNGRWNIYCNKTDCDALIQAIDGKMLEEAITTANGDVFKPMNNIQFGRVIGQSMDPTELRKFQAEMQDVQLSEADSEWSFVTKVAPKKNRFKKQSTTAWGSPNTASALGIAKGRSFPTHGIKRGGGLESQNLKTSNGQQSEQPPDQTVGFRIPEEGRIPVKKKERGEGGA